MAHSAASWRPSWGALLAGGASACTCGAPGDGRPLCDDPTMLAMVRDIADDHPDHAPLLPARSVALVDVRETSAEALPDIGSHTFRRLCVGTLVLANGERVASGWEVFTTDTVLGPSFGITPCFGPYDRARRDCAAIERGTQPGAVTPPSP